MPEQPAPADAGIAEARSPAAQRAAASAAEEADGDPPEGAQHAPADTMAAAGDGGRDSRQLKAALRTSLQARPLAPYQAVSGCPFRLCPVAQ